MPFRERFESFFSRPKVQKQLVTIFILVLLVPIAFCCFLLYESYTSLREHYLEQIASDNLRVRSILFEVTTNLYNVSEDIVHDDVLFEVINTQYASPQDVRMAVSSYTTISNIMSKDTSISSVNIYTFNETIGDYSYFHTITPEIQKSDWFISASEKASPFWRTHCRTDSRGNIYWELSLYRKIPLPQLGSYAVLSVTASDNYLRNRIINNSMECIMTINENPVFFSTDKNYLGKSIPVDIDYESRITNASGIIELSGTPEFTVISTLLPMNSDDRLYIVSYHPTALNELTQLIRNYILIIAAVILIPCVMSFIYSQYFSARVMTLRKAMHQASHGNYEIMDVFSGDEDGEVTSHSCSGSSTSISI